MEGRYDAADPGLGRFDRSFLVQMILDFFVILVLVTVLEFAIKVGLVVYDFASNGDAEASDRAEQLAENVRSIMLNEGGPVAARTIYPIIDRNMADIGFEIAIEPAPITVDAIRENFGFVPQGIPAGDWSEGRHREARIDIHAETACLACHTTASVGDRLGTVTVRTYLAQDIALWWDEVKLSAGLAIGKIVLHSVLLFLLLKARMEPLMRLRAVVSNLARAYGGLGHRAEIRSRDEFGVLARDLNLFLDRITGLVDELDLVLKRVVSVNNDIVAIQGALREGVDGFVAGTRDMERRALMNAKREPMLSKAWFAAIRRSIDDLDAAIAQARGNSPESGEARRVLDALAAVVDNAQAQISTNEALFEDLCSLGRESEKFQSAMAEMARLEERLQAIVETGSRLVRRLRPGDTPAE